MTNSTDEFNFAKANIINLEEYEPIEEKKEYIHDFPQIIQSLTEVQELINEMELELKGISAFDAFGTLKMIKMKIAIVKALM